MSKCNVECCDIKSYVNLKTIKTIHNVHDYFQNQQFHGYSYQIFGLRHIAAKKKIYNNEMIYLFFKAI